MGNPASLRYKKPPRTSLLRRGLLAGECDPGEILEKLGRALGSSEWSKWLNETMQAFAVALTGVAERRMNDVVAALFLAQVGGSVYAAARLLGKSSEEALREAEEALCRIHRAALEVLRESYRSGKLEEQYKAALRELGGGGAGSGGGGEA